MKREMKITIAIIGTGLAAAGVIILSILFFVPGLSPGQPMGGIAPTPAIPPVFQVDRGVNGSDYSAMWNEGSEMFRYERGVAFFVHGGQNIFIGTYYDLAANSVGSPADRPGLLLQGGVWFQNESEIEVFYNNTYRVAELDSLTMGKNTAYDYRSFFRCLDMNCSRLIDTDTAQVFTKMVGNSSVFTPTVAGGIP